MCESFSPLWLQVSVSSDTSEQCESISTDSPSFNSRAFKYFPTAPARGTVVTRKAVLHGRNSTSDPLQHLHSKKLSMNHELNER